VGGGAGIVDRGPAAWDAFVRAHTTLDHAPSVPEVALHLATEVTPLWYATERWLEERGVPPPFWAFAWAGGQGLARFVLDRPEVVRGRRVLDFACGGGISAIAAALAGAARVRAVDIDPLAVAACRRNAAANGVELEVTGEDLVGRPVEGVDVLLAGDIWYERPAALRFEAWLRDVAASGVRVISGDPGRAYVPEGVAELAAIEVPTSIDLEGRTSREVRVLEIVAAAGAGR
jgi:predicted nicotinamide N-methyase